MNSACGRHALFALLAAGCLAPVLAQVNVTTYHNDVACILSIAGAAHEVLYIMDKHDSI